MIYLFKRASSDFNRVLKTLGYEIAQAKSEYEMKTHMLEYFSESCLGLDDIKRDEEVRFKLNEVFMALTDGEIERAKSHIERLESVVKAMIPHSLLELVGLDFDGKKVFNHSNLDLNEYAEYARLISIISHHYLEDEIDKAEYFEKKLYELVRVSELSVAVDNKMPYDELLDICAEYLKKCKDPEAKMIAFLINKAKA